MSTHPHGIHQGSHRRLSFPGRKPAGSWARTGEPARQVGSHDPPQPSSSRPSTGPSLCHDRRRTRPTHDALAIETLVSTTCTVDLTPKLTVEQRAISALCNEILWSPRRDSNPRPSDTESDDKASGPEWEDSCGAEGDARPPTGVRCLPEGAFHSGRRSPPSGEARCADRGHDRPAGTPEGPEAGARTPT